MKLHHMTPLKKQKTNIRSGLELSMWVDNAISRPIRMYFTRWLIRTNLYDLPRMILYDLSRPQWWVGLGVGHTYKFIRIVQLLKYVQFSKNRMNLYEWGLLHRKICTNCCEIGLEWNGVLKSLNYNSIYTVNLQILPCTAISTWCYQ